MLVRAFNTDVSNVHGKGCLKHGAVPRPYARLRCAAQPRLMDLVTKPHAAPSATTPPLLLVLCRATQHARAFKAASVRRAASLG